MRRLKKVLFSQVKLIHILTLNVHVFIALVHGMGTRSSKQIMQLTGLQGLLAFNQALPEQVFWV
jgi:hypothetical protein